jgi:hypothetical protein
LQEIPSFGLMVLSLTPLFVLLPPQTRAFHVRVLSKFRHALEPPYS